MRPDENDTRDGGTDGSLADGMSDVSSSADRFGEDSYVEDTYDEPFDEDNYGDGGVDAGDSGDDTFGDGSTEPDDDGTGIVVPSDDTTVLDPDDAAVEEIELDMTGEENDPLEGVGYLIEELRDALLGEDDESGALSGPSPFDADPADVASDSDLDLTGDGLVDGHDLHEAGSVFDFDVSDG